MLDGGCDPEKKDCQERHGPLVSIKKYRRSDFVAFELSKKLAIVQSFFFKIIL